MNIFYINELIGYIDPEVLMEEKTCKLNFMQKTDEISISYTQNWLLCCGLLLL